MSEPAVALAFLLVAGWPSARVLTGDRVLALVWAPLCAALLAVPAVLLSLIVGTGLRVTFVVLWAMSLAVLVRRARRWPRLPPTNRQGLLAVVLLTAFTLWTIRQGASGWDARSQFWLKADWFWSGGQEARLAMRNPAFAFSHAEYPPLVPSAIAALWSFVGAGDERLAQALSGLLTHSTLLGVAAALLMLPLRVSKWARVCVAASFVLAAHGLTGDWATNGYADVLCAGLLATAAVLLLVHPPGAQAVAMGVACLVGAALAKPEGGAAALLFLAMVIVRHRRRLAWAVPVAAAAAVGPAWSFVAHLLGADADLLAGDPVGRALRPGLGTRLALIVDNEWAFLRLTVVAGLLVAVFAAVGLRDVRRAAGLWSFAALPMAALGTVATLTAAYLITPYPLEWHVGTSVDRVTFVPVLLLLADVAVWALLAAHAWTTMPAGAHRSAPERTGPPVDVLR